MSQKLQEIPQKVMEWWNKFTSKQKTIIICVSAVVVLALGILFTVVSKPQYEMLAICETTKEAATIKDLLESEGYVYQLSDDGLQIQVLSKDLSKANVLLGANDIPTVSYDLEKVFSGGFSTTEADKQKKYKLYLEKQMEEDLQSYSFVKSARVQLTLPENDGTLIAKSEEASASIILELDGELPDDAASSLAIFATNALGNKTANKIVIMDSAGNLLYSGEDNYSISGSASNQLTVKQQAESLIANAVRKVLLGTEQFGKIEVASNLVLDFSSYDKTSHEYEAPAGRTEGMLSSKDTFSSESSGSSGGTPGTDANTETTYAFEDQESNNSSTSEQSDKYLPNEIITSQNIPPGLIKYDESSISVSAVVYKVLKEEDAKSQGLLDGITWNEYKIANEAQTKVEVEEEIINMIAKASGIALEDIAILMYEKPIFMDKEGLGVTASDIIQVVLIIVILGLLAFVVLKSMAGAKQEEPEEEISVENLLQSTPATELENIELDDKSETRKVIEQFVQDNPEAVANLLRNWLNEEWGG